MSVQFLIGRSGTGKTTTILNKIKSALRETPEGPPVIYIVPEQMTFLSEYRLVNTPDLTGMIRTQVYSFTRLAWRVLQETGGANRKQISSTGLNMLIRKIIEDHKEELRLFQQVADRNGFIQHIETMLTEFQHYCLTPEDLAQKKEELAFNVSTRALADKLHDLEMIYTYYEQALLEKYIGANDYLRMLAESVEKSVYLDEAEIYIDGFHNFTPQEYRVIEELMKKCKKVTIALTLDRPYKFGTVPEDLDLFRLTGETYSTLYEIVQGHQIELEEDIVLAQPYRFKTPSIQYLQAQFDKRPYKKYQAKPELMIRAGANRRAEIEGIAREIRRLVMEEGYRYRDLAILVRNGQEYHDLIETVFPDHSIPYFLDQKRSMLHHPLIELIQSALDIVNGNWRYESVFRAVKTDLLFPMDQNISVLREKMDRLENYVLAHGIRGERWTKKERWPYKRFLGLEMENIPQTDEERVLEEEINESRHLIIEPLVRFSKRLKKAKTGMELCKALYLMLEELRIPEKLTTISQKEEAKGNLIAAKENAQAWNKVIELVDQFVEVLGEETFTIEDFAKVIYAGLESACFSLIPPAIDQVAIANMELSRLSEIKVAFVIGMNDGVLPAAFSENGVLSDQDRTDLHLHGLAIAPGGRRKLLDEDFIAYRAFTVASQYLYLSYPIANDEGKSLLPSPYIKKLQELFPEAEVINDVVDPSELPFEEQYAYVSHPNTTLGYLSTQLQLRKRNYPIPDFWWDIYNFYMDDPQYKLKAKNILSSLFYTNQTQSLSEKTSHDLYGDEILASVSRMEKFHGCPFSHFVSHGLRLKERTVYKLEAPHIGDLFHAALKWIAEEIDRKGLSWADLSKEQYDLLAREAVNMLAPKLLNQILLSSHRYSYIKRKLEQIIGRTSYALGTQARSSEFIPVGIELAFGPAKELPPLTFTLKNGAKMQLQGRIDRVDKAEAEHGVYVRILDYKSSSRAIDLNEVYHGLALQMLTYLDIVLTYSTQLIGKEALPAGMLYFHVHNPFIDSDKLLTIEDIENEMQKRFKMKGLLLGDPHIVQLMDTSLETGTSTIVNAGINKDGTLSARSKASAATKEDFQYLRKYVRKMYQDSGNRIISGDVEISPYQMGNQTPCQFCPFKSVCQFDQSLEKNEYRVIQKQSVDQVLHYIKEADLNENTDSK